MSISQELTFDWSLASDEFPEDNMGRAEHAKNLTRFMVQKGQEGSYVLNLNAKWGTGKTYFLRRWVKEIEHKYPTVYIDAWSGDHSSDPLLSVVSEVKKELHNLNDISDIELRLFEGVAKAVKAAAPAAVKAVVNGQLKRLGINPEEFGEIFTGEDVADAGAKLVELAIKAHNEASAGVKNIKTSIQDWLASVVEMNIREYPLFIFIDELDRCRPTYAIEMLETIKHIFDMKNVVFVVATDKEQLQHSIKAIYGAEFDSRLYLDRFFTHTITLNNPSRSEFIIRKISTSETFKNFVSDDNNFVFVASQKGRNYDINHLLTGIADGFNWPLRKVNLWIDRLEAALIISDRKMDIIMLSFLLALETDDTDWLRKYQEKVPIFRTNNDHEGKVKFKTFSITTPWNFSKFKYTFLSNGFYVDETRIMKTFEPNVGLLDFIKNRLSVMSKGNKDTFEAILESYRHYIDRGMIIKGDEITNGVDYDVAAIQIYAAFHFEHKTTLNHYLELCRYSSFMSD